MSDIKIPNCPICGSKMILRTNKRGNKAGKQLWICSNYPNCYGKVDYKGERIDVGSIVSIQECDTGIVFFLEIIPSRNNVRYVGHGYRRSNYVKVTKTSDADGTTTISDDSPIGKQLIGKYESEEVTVSVDGHISRYMILSVQNS